MVSFRSNESCLRTTLKQREKSQCWRVLTRGYSLSDFRDGDRSLNMLSENRSSTALIWAPAGLPPPLYECTSSRTKWRIMFPTFLCPACSAAGTLSEPTAHRVYANGSSCASWKRGRCNDNVQHEQSVLLLKPFSMRHVPSSALLRHWQARSRHPCGVTHTDLCTAAGLLCP